MGTGGALGTCQARPQARGSVAAVTRVRATSGTYVQVCGASQSTGRNTRCPASTLGSTIMGRELPPSPM